MIRKIPSCGIRYLAAAPGRKRQVADFTDSAVRQVQRFHRTLPGYRPTGLVRLDRLARRWKIGDILVKDESDRFGLNAFKVLGGSYAVARLVAQQLEIPWEQVAFSALTGDAFRHRLASMTLATATDGNHGRGVAWTAEQLGMQAVIFMPKGSAPARVENIRRHGARVEVTDLNYDDAVRLVWQKARQRGWQVVQDTAREGYRDIPRWIMQGYTTMTAEAVAQMAGAGLHPTHVFVQAGVGSFAAAMVAHLARVYADQPPRFIVVEPDRAACMLASARAGDGRPHAVTGDLDTIMAGLACGEPSPPAWDILWEWACCFISCGNATAANGMRILANPVGDDEAIEAGESGAVGIGLLDLLANHPDCSSLSKALELGPGATVLVFNTEGATDPVNYRDVIWYGKYGG
ncbi:PLP-dependent lyase/thiolase [Desulfosarcina alkanivorans]|uniref:PLP-dependent lyase/thiolase n=1 Tax=Desulfosarcina alkanivorans TaxID=571177 RepID=A0A5K7YK87_9BACT|nr:diaminopropionate ammonia-lyase [Desulfosarcina alkanivorans]BBO69616.1 PLP-dependent lyase/thiolase [Desulfosarcina alkanivorans]